jgi:ADP-heptose:LPS heptosyltransferase
MTTSPGRGLLNVGTGASCRLVVLRALQLGDLLCAVPAFRALRRALPRAHVALVGLPWARDFVDRFQAYLDEFIEFPGFPGLPEQEANVTAFPAFLDEVQRRRFDAALQMHGDGTTTNALVALFGARDMAGFWLAGSPAPAGAHLVVYPEWLSEPRRHLYFVDWLMGGAGDVRDDGLEFPIRSREEGDWDVLRRTEGLVRRGYACIHAGARAAARRWPAARFAEVASWLVSRGLPVVLTGHGEEESAAAREIARACGRPAVDLSDRTSMGVLACAIRDARLLLCNDTGVSHVAAALGTPSVVIFRTTDPARWAPANRRRHRVVRDGACAARRVITEAEALLAAEGVRAA